MTDQLTALTRKNVDSDPFRQFERWYEAMRTTGVSEQDATSMILATARADGQPSARVVLLKSFDDRGFVFFTNYQSQKGSDLKENPRASLLFYWSALWRQVRVEGQVEKISDAESEEYFQSRPLGSRIGAWASNQSEVIADRETLEARFEELEQRFGEDVPRPEHWGGYRVKPNSFEFWQGRDNRLHDRLRYRREGEAWVIERLAP